MPSKKIVGVPNAKMKPLSIIMEKTKPLSDCLSKETRDHCVESSKRKSTLERCNNTDITVRPHSTIDLKQKRPVCIALDPEESSSHNLNANDSSNRVIETLLADCLHDVDWMTPQMMSKLVKNPPNIVKEFTTSKAHDDVLETAPVNPNREEDRRVHITEEVVQGHFEESSNFRDDSVAPEVGSKSGCGITSWKGIHPEPDQKWKCVWIKGQPVGKAATKLGTVLGLYGRLQTHFPIYKEWRQQSTQSWNDLWHDIKEDYDFVDETGVEPDARITARWCKLALQKSIRNFRCMLKATYYDPYDNDDIRRLKHDKRLTVEVWERLLMYWDSSKKQTECRRNKMNRSKQQIVSTIGRKSIAVVKHEKKLSLKENYTELQAFLDCHKKKGGLGDYPNEYTKEKCEAVQVEFEKRNLSTCGDQNVFPPILDKVYGGHHGGYERGIGMGWSRSKLKDTPENHAAHEKNVEFHQRIQMLEEENEKLRSKLKQTEFVNTNMGGGDIQYEVLKSKEDTISEKDKPTSSVPTHLDASTMPSNDQPVDGTIGSSKRDLLIRSLSTPKWCPPPKGCMKGNFQGDVYKGVAVAAYVVRDEEGVILWCNSEMVQPKNIFVAELFALTLLLQSINDVECPWFMEGTSEIVLGLASDNSEYETPPACIKQLVDGCRSKIKESTAITMKQIPPCMNLAAQKFAEHAVDNSKFGYWYYGQIPSAMLEYMSSSY